MFKHILLPTDGSPASEAAVRATMQLAALHGAKVTGLYVLPDLHAFSRRPAAAPGTVGAAAGPQSGAGASPSAGAGDGPGPQDAVHAGDPAAAPLRMLSDAARAHGVVCDTVLLRGDRPHRKILDTAHMRGCDLIAMATRGALGLKGVLLGSETRKVLEHSTVPVLLFRPD